MVDLIECIGGSTYWWSGITCEGCVFSEAVWIDDGYRIVITSWVAVNADIGNADVDVNIIKFSGWNV